MITRRQATLHTYGQRSKCSELDVNPAKEQDKDTSDISSRHVRVPRRLIRAHSQYKASTRGRRKASDDTAGKSPMVEHATNTVAGPEYCRVHQTTASPSISQCTGQHMPDHFAGQQGRKDTLDNN